MPAARRFIRSERLNEILPGDIGDVGIIVMGGLTNSILRALERLELADIYGASRIPIYVLNVVYPLVPEEVRAFCAGKRSGARGRGRLARLHRAADQRRIAARRLADAVLGKGVLPESASTNRKPCSAPRGIR